jgi:hypothetical protein
LLSLTIPPAASVLLRARFCHTCSIKQLLEYALVRIPTPCSIYISSCEHGIDGPTAFYIRLYSDFSSRADDWTAQASPSVMIFSDSCVTTDKLNACGVRFAFTKVAVHVSADEFVHAMNLFPRTEHLFLFDLHNRDRGMLVSLGLYNARRLQRLKYMYRRHGLARGRG